MPVNHMDLEREESSAEESRLLSGRAALLILLSLLLHAPSLGWGFFVDDHVHEMVLSGELENDAMRPWALYRFGALADQRELRDAEGAVPFWTADTWRAEFLRPVASLSRWAEHVVFDGEAIWAHAVGLLWWAVYMVLAWRLFLALGLGPRASLWSLALIGLENGASFAVGWLANRNSIVEGVFLLSAVLLFIRGARSGSRGRLLAAFACAGLAVLSKESGVSAFLLIAAWSWLGRRSARSLAFERGRARWAAWGIGLALLYVSLYVALGYGTKSAFYPTPWGEPGAWLARLGLAIPGGAVAMLTPLATDAVHVLPVLIPVTVAVGVTLILLFKRFLAPVVGAHAAGVFLVLWILVTLTPQAGAPLSDRLFLVPMVGVAGCLGLFLEATRQRSLAGWASRGERIVARGVIVSGVALSGLALVATSLSMVETARFSRMALTEAEVGPRSLGRREVIVLQSPSQMVSLQPSAGYTNLTGDDQVRFWVLSATRRGVRWTRTGPRSFTLEALQETFMSSIFESVFLVGPPDFEEGQVWDNQLFSVRAHDLLGGFPRRLEVECKRDLEDPNLRFLAWQPAQEDEAGFGLWKHFPPPLIGESITLERPPAPVPLIP